MRGSVHVLQLTATARCLAVKISRIAQYAGGTSRRTKLEMLKEKKRTDRQTNKSRSARTGP